LVLKTKIQEIIIIVSFMDEYGGRDLPAMQSFTNKTVLVTGATDGIGKGVALELARLGATVLLHGRDSDRLAKTLAEIKAKTHNHTLETYVADFSSLEAVHGLATDIIDRHERLDVLINNAGIGRGPRSQQSREISLDQFELRFQVNYLAPFLLTHLLLPLLQDHTSARIVNVASASQEKIEFDDVMLEQAYDGTRAYSQSKLAMVMATFELAKRLEPNNITVNALHPGSLLNTKIVREAWGQAHGPVETGIESEIYLATSPKLNNVSGTYFDQQRPVQAHPQAYDELACQQLWEMSLQLTGLKSYRRES
jgi:NAD(P)-dependent dehydrogenase (short-subunit alcohol dehydrogenase family)